MRFREEGNEEGDEEGNEVLSESSGKCFRMTNEALWSGGKKMSSDHRKSDECFWIYQIKLPK